MYTSGKINLMADSNGVDLTFYIETGGWSLEIRKSNGNFFFLFSLLQCL